MERVGEETGTADQFAYQGEDREPHWDALRLPDDGQAGREMPICAQ